MVTVPSHPFIAGASLFLTNVSVWRETGGRKVSVTTDVTLRIQPGERVFLLGPNGAGKTSLLLAIVGAVPFDGGIALGNIEVTKGTLDRVRKHIGFVFADPSDQLFLDEVREEVAFGPHERGLADIDRRVVEALQAVSLEHCVGRSPRDLSLGEQRRLAIATALALSPDVFLLDEPTAALDPRGRQRVLEVIEGLPATIVIATHDLEAARQIGGRAVLLRHGRVIADGTCSEVLSDEGLLDRAGLSVRGMGRG